MGKKRSVQDFAAVTLASTVVIPANDHRSSIAIQNCGTNPVWIAFGRPAVANQCFLLPAGSLPFEFDADYLGDGIGLPISAIATTGVSALAYMTDQN